MSAHTPGPWSVDPRGGGCVRGSRWREYTRGRAYSQVALATGDADIDPAEVDANAKLIAAAPDLAEALRPFARRGGTVSECNFECGTCHGCRARAALSRAGVSEGGE